MDLQLPLAALAGYLLGSIPFGFLTARAKGIDIRQHGSGNIGATNVLRVLGKPWGYLVFALDALKGIASVLLLPLLLGSIWGSEQTPSVALAAGLACILGHNFPVWLGFKGGKGIATTAGVLIALMPVAVGAGLLVWLVFFYTTGYVSLASIAAAAAIPPTVWFMQGKADLLFAFSLLLAVLAIWRHRSNIRRLLDGTENRFRK